MEKARGVAALPCAVLVLSLVQPADGVLPMHGRACLATSSPCVVGMRLRGGASVLDRWIASAMGCDRYGMQVIVTMAAMPLVCGRDSMN